MEVKQRRSSQQKEMKTELPRLWEQDQKVATVKKMRKMVSRRRVVSCVMSF